MNDDGRVTGDEALGDGALGDEALGDEARRLLGAIEDWARRTLPAPPSGHPGPECQWCPLCQFASLLRGEHPELTERFADAGAALGHALTALLESLARRGVPVERPGSGPRPSPRPRVHHIRLDDDADDGTNGDADQHGNEGDN